MGLGIVLNILVLERFWKILGKNVWEPCIYEAQLKNNQRPTKVLHSMKIINHKTSNTEHTIYKWGEEVKKNHGSQINIIFRGPP